MVGGGVAVAGNYDDGLHCEQINKPLIYHRLSTNALSLPPFSPSPTPTSHTPFPVLNEGSFASTRNIPSPSHSLFSFLEEAEEKHDDGHH